MKTCRIENQKIFNLGVDRQVVLSFERLFTDFIERYPFFTAATCEKILSIYLQISKVLVAENTTHSVTDRRLDSVIGYIHKNYANPLTVKELAEKSFVSAGRLRVLFKERTGLSPYAYLQNLRLAYARQLMLQSDLTIQEIATSSGYDDPLYFSRAFKKRFGISPGAFRRS